MPLTFEQFQDLRKKGLSEDQILRFEKGEVPQGVQGEQLRSTGILGFGRGLLKGIGSSLFNIGKLGEQLGGRRLSQLSEKVVSKATGTPEQEIQPLFGEEPEILKAKTTAEKAGKITETVAEVLAPFPGGKAKAGESLLLQARKLYQSALKPAGVLGRAKQAQVVETGLREGIRLTNAGIDKTAAKIEELEGALGSAIDASADAGGFIKTKTLKPFVEEAKQLFGKVTDVNFAKNSVAKIDDLYRTFVREYGLKIPVKLAQELKTNTYSLLRKAYGEMGSAAVEGNKALARGLKEGVLAVAPQVDDINKRLGALYEFENTLEKASSRIGNLNVISLGSKVLTGFGGKTGVLLAALNQLGGSPAAKTARAVFYNQLGNILKSKDTRAISALKKVSIPLFGVNFNNLIQTIRKETTSQP